MNHCRQGASMLLADKNATKLHMERGLAEGRAHETNSKRTYQSFLQILSWGCTAHFVMHVG